MPRKTNGILYELSPRPTKGEDGKLFARVSLTDISLSISL